MALHWNWNERCGWMVLENAQGDTEIVNLYEGNAFLLMIKETEQGFSMWSFWADEQHAKNCLGLSRGYDNIYLGSAKIVKVIFNKKKSANYKKIIPLLIRAFDNISIEVISE